jgi:hypothetical protein
MEYNVSVRAYMREKFSAGVSESWSSDRNKIPRLCIALRSQYLGRRFSERKYYSANVYQTDNATDKLLNAFRAHARVA